MEVERKLLSVQPMSQMPHRLHAIAVTLFALIPLWPGRVVALDPSHPEPVQEKAPDASRCLELDSRDEAALNALRAFRVSNDHESQAITAVRITGLRSLDEQKLWAILGPRPAQFTPEQAAALVARVAETGLFRDVVPTLHVDAGGGGAVLEIAVVELPRVERVTIQGLTEVSPGDLLDVLLEVPGGEGAMSVSAGEKDDDEDEGDDDERDELRHGISIRVDEDGWTRCPPPRPPSEMLARPKAGGIVPGVVWKGLPAAFGRVLEHLWNEGYLLATLEADLAPDGTLTIDVDEGRLASIELVGVPPDLQREVRRELDLKPDQIFVMGDVESAVRRVNHRFPFLETRPGPGTPSVRRRVVQRETKDGHILFSTQEEQRGRRRGDGKRDRKITWSFGNGPSRRGEIQLGDLPVDLPFDLGNEVPDYAVLEGRGLKLYFGEDRTALKTDWVELLRHTPVTGFSPGLGVEGMLWDPGNRVHFGLDGVLHLNTGRGDRPVDYLVGPKIRVPAIGLAELGGHIYALMDTSDAWRNDRLDSYLFSMVFNRPFQDYYRRTGYSAFATLMAARQLVVGGEYRYDTYQSMGTVTGVTWFGQIPPWSNPPVTPGQMGSVIGRLEWSTRKEPMENVGGWRRHPETSLVERDWYGELEPGFLTVNTVEVADPRMGGTFRFVKVVTDNSLHVRTARDQGLRLRFRGEGGTNLPIQKMPSLGGWGSLRGYMFKEFTGDTSALVMAEYQLNFISGFVDGGSVHTPAGWLLPKIGLGAAVNLGDHFRIEAAWRTDQYAHLMPEVKAVINRTF